MNAGRVVSSCAPIKIGELSFSCSTPILMGIVNLTPDSFSDGGRLTSLDATLSHIEQLIKDGADWIDVGAESSRPGSDLVSISTEIDRLSPLLSCYKRHFSAPLSIDTTKSEVAAFALSKGADLINDISGLTDDPKMVQVIGNAGVPVVLMHRQGMNKTMQQAPVYGNVVDEVKAFFKAQLAMTKQHGIQQCILDPGIGFGKSVTHNLALINQLDAFQDLECPLLIGTSNKSFIGDITGDPVTSRAEGTLVSNLFAYLRGAHVFRVHDVCALKKAFQVFDAIQGESYASSDAS